MNNKVTLVYADKGTLIYPQGILVLASIATAAGYHVDILDTRVTQVNPELFKERLLVGISTMTGNQINESLELCKLIRATAPETIIAWGGIHPSILPEETIRHPLVDVVVRGEGEVTFLELLKCLQKGNRDFSKIAGITWKNNSGKIFSNPDCDLINLDTLPTLRYDLLDIDKYPSTKEYFPYTSSRGCPFRCTFCYNQAMGGMWRSRSPEKIIQDLTTIHNTYGLEHGVHFLDDNLFTNPAYIREICERKLSANLNFTWNGSSTIRGFLRFIKSDFDLFKKAGLEFVRFGAESGSPRIIGQIRKNFAPEETFTLLEKCQEHDITAVFNFMTGFPDENDDDRKMTFDLIDALHARFGSHFRVKTIWRLLPFPGTEVFREAIEQGYEAPKSLEEWGGYGFTNMPRLPWMSQATFEELETVNHITRYNFLQPITLSFNTIRKQKLRDLLWTLSARLRWKYRYFRFPVEWAIRRAYIQRQSGQGSI